MQTTSVDLGERRVPSVRAAAIILTLRAIDRNVYPLFFDKKGHR